MKKYIWLTAACLLASCATRPKPMIAISHSGPEPVSGRSIPGTNIWISSQNGREDSPYNLFNAWFERSSALASPCAEAGNGNPSIAVAGVIPPACPKPAGTPEDAKNAAVSMMSSGFEYSALLCDSYFNLLANNNQDLGFGTESVGILGGFASGVLGLTGAPTKSVSLVATGFAATVAGMEAYQQHYHFGPDVSAVRKLITTGQRNYKAAIDAQILSEFDHYDAIGHIKAHQEICQVDSIQFKR
jgi:hypothetical protein